MYVSVYEYMGVCVCRCEYVSVCRYVNVCEYMGVCGSVCRGGCVCACCFPRPPGAACAQMN